MLSQLRFRALSHGWGPPRVKTLIRVHCSSKGIPVREQVLKDKVVVETHVISEHAGRIADILPKLFPTRLPSSTGAKRACRRGEVLVDGTPAITSTLVNPGQLIEVIVRASPGTGHDQHRAQVESSEQRLQVIYEDDHMACVLKPPGLPCQGKGTSTAQGLMPYSLQPVNIPGALRKPCNAHRLDALTGGLLLAAKTRPALQQLCADFAAPGTIQKRYVAIVKGRVEGKGLIDLPLGGKPSATAYEAVHHTDSLKWGCLTTVSLWPKTGRTHQLRKHMAYTGTPILGDPRYRGPKPQHGELPAVSTPMQEGLEVASAEAPVASAVRHDNSVRAAAARSPILAQQHSTTCHEEVRGEAREDFTCRTTPGSKALHGPAASEDYQASAALLRCGDSQDPEMQPGDAELIQHGGSVAAGKGSSSLSSGCLVDPASPPRVAAPDPAGSIPSSNSSSSSSASNNSNGSNSSSSSSSSASNKSNGSSNGGSNGSSESAGSGPGGSPGNVRGSPGTPRTDIPSPGNVSCQGSPGDVLSDGVTAVQLCLWAVELTLPHPITRAALHFQLPMPRVFEEVCMAEKAAL